MTGKTSGLYDAVLLISSDCFLDKMEEEYVWILAKLGRSGK